MGCSHSCYYTQQNPNIQELTAPSATFFQGLGATWLWSENQSSPQAHLATWGCGSSQRHDGTGSDTRINPPSPREAGLNLAVNCSMLSCSHLLLHPCRDLFLPEEPAQSPVTALGGSPSTAKPLKMQHNLSEVPPQTAGPCIWEAERKETRKHSGVLATDYWTNRE